MTQAPPASDPGPVWTCGFCGAENSIHMVRCGLCSHHPDDLQ